MSRRLFFERMAALVGISVAAPFARATTSRQIELQRSPVAGFQYHQGEVVWLMLVVGTSLTLVREPENQYDPRAVRVDWQGHKLGYVPRIDNAAVSHLLDSDQVVAATIVSVRECTNRWDRIEFAVHFMS